MKTFVLLIPLWLLAVIFPPTLDSGYMDVLQVGTLVWLPVIGLLTGRGEFLVGPIFRERMSALFWMCASLTAIAASALMSVDPARSSAYVLSAAIGIVCCAGLWRLVGSRIIHSLAIYAVLGTIFVTYIYFFGPRIQDRLSISLTSHPNYLGLVSFGLLMCSLALKNHLLTAGIIVMNFVVIVATQSRGSLVAALLGLSVYLTLKTLRARKVRVVLTVVGAVIVAAVLLMLYQDEIGNWFSSLLFLNDKYRGIGTGFTGRLDAWQEAFDLFLGNPWFGVGFRMHEQYMTTLSSAHNGYLSLLAEVGSIGGIALLVLTMGACGRLLRQALRGDTIAMLGLGFVAGYFFLATFERFFLNMGNPTSILTWLFLLMPARRTSAVQMNREQTRSIAELAMSPDRTAAQTIPGSP
jgi:O-antigen ligase